MPKPLALLFLVIFPLYLTWTFDHDLWNPDETRDAGIAREMFVEKDFAVPRLNGEAFLEKPPLYYWAASAVYAVAGGRVTAGLTRLPAALFGFLGVLFTFLIGRRFFNERVGLISALILATAAQYFRMSHFALMDSTLAAMIAGAFYFYMCGQDLLFILFIVLAFYTKGFVAIALPGLVLLADTWASRDFKRLAIISVVGVVGFVVLVTPWVLQLKKAGGAAFLQNFFVENNLHRFTSSQGDHHEPFYFYFGSFIVDFLPWTFFFAGAAVRFLYDARHGFAERADRFISTWFVVMLGFLSLSASKRSIYLLPAFPAAALMSGVWLDRYVLKGLASKWESASVQITFGLSLLAVMAVFVMNAVWHQGTTSAIVAGVIIASSVVIFRKLRAQNLPYEMFLSSFLLFGFAIVAASRLLMPQLNDDKSFVPFVRTVQQRAQGAEIVGMDLSEMERGVFPFYLQQNIRNFTTAQDLKQFLDQNHGKPVAVIANKNKLNDLNSWITERCELVARFRPTEKTRSYLLYFSRPG